MAITDKRARERYDALRALALLSAQHLAWMLPFLDHKARESGDVAGIQNNVRRLIDEINGTLRAYDVEDIVEAKTLAEEATS